MADITSAELVYNGKTKAVYRLPDGNYLLKFKDDVTGTDGVFDPGANSVGLSIDGMGLANLRMSTHFFEKFGREGIATQYIGSDVESGTMTVRPAENFGEGIEIICRFRAVGSFIRRYGKYAQEGLKLPAFVEITLKDDERGDPPISKDGLELLGILKEGEYDCLVGMTRKISQLIYDELAAKGAELYDIKLEFGKNGDEIMLIDEVSGGNMRVYKDGASLSPFELTELVLR